MIWLVWRQHRKQALFALLGLAALAAFMIPTGLRMHGEFQRAGLDDCIPAAARVEFVSTDLGTAPVPGQLAACRTLASQFASRSGSMSTIGILLWFLPLLVGLFWGAPLVARELEHGTHRLVWTQGVSRLRWALAKFGLVGAGVLLAATCYALLVTWWRAPLDQATGRQYVSPGPTYDLVGLVPIGYALFALALGVLAGVLTRKSQAAMAVTLVGYMATRVLVELATRPHLLTPERRTFPVLGNKAPNELVGDWIISAGIYSAQGKRLSSGALGAYSQSVCSMGPNDQASQAAWPSTAPAPTTRNCSIPPTASGCSRASKPPCSPRSPRSCSSPPSAGSAASPDDRPTKLPVTGRTGRRRPGRHRAGGGRSRPAPARPGRPPPWPRAGRSGR